MAILDPQSFECLSHSDEQTERLGARLGGMAPPGTVVALVGQLGAGKTQFARGFGAGWGAEQVLRSPTFTLVQQHHRPADAQTLYHIDLYRLGSAHEVNSLGLDEILDDPFAISLVEWADRAPNTLPARAIFVKFDVINTSKRGLMFSTKSAETWKILLKLRKELFGV